MKNIVPKRLFQILTYNEQVKGSKLNLIPASYSSLCERIVLPATTGSLEQLAISLGVITFNNCNSRLAGCQAFAKALLIFKTAYHAVTKTIPQLVMYNAYFSDLKLQNVLYNFNKNEALAEGQLKLFVQQPLPDFYITDIGGFVFAPKGADGQPHLHP